jgi:hypothetical protein
MTCKSGAPTLDGSKFSSTRTANSLTGRAAKSLMLKEAKTRKAKQLEFGVTIEADINNGKLSILMKLKDHRLRDLIKNGDSMLIDHSILFLNFHSTE